MNTYDTDTRRLNVGTICSNLRAVLRRWLDREMRADALRLRWLADDHADPEARKRVRSICESIPTRSISGVRIDIDAAMRP